MNHRVAHRLLGVWTATFRTLSSLCKAGVRFRGYDFPPRIILYRICIANGIGGHNGLGFLYFVTKVFGMFVFPHELKPTILSPPLSPKRCGIAVARTSDGRLLPAVLAPEPLQASGQPCHREGLTPHRLGERDCCVFSIGVRGRRTSAAYLQLH